MTHRLPVGARIDAIVIGASAGGVEALSVILPALPAALAAPVLVVLHVPRDSRHLLVDIFEPKCALAVREACDKEAAAPGVIYFAPSDYHLLVDRGPQLALSIDEPVHFSRPSIDVLFESAADVFGDRLMGIILTGGNQDGAAGLRAIARAGGITIVQDPATACMSLMPQAALKQVQPTFVLSVRQIADLLHHFTAGQ